MLSTTLMLIVSLTCSAQTKISLESLNWPKPPMKYADNPIWGDTDLFFDRVVVLTLDIPNYKNSSFDYRNIATGVLIDSSRILTAYNPFRDLVKSAEMLTKTYVTIFTGRQFTGNNRTYLVDTYAIKCGRQVQYLPDEKITAAKLWHDPLKRHTCVHDLMVVKIKGTIPDEDLSTIDYEEYTYEKYMPDPKNVDYYVGSMVTELANVSDVLYLKHLKFAGLGVRDKNAVRRFNRIFVVSYTEEEEVLADCERWIPRDWGIFICLANIYDLHPMGAGAVLVSNNKLFGIGAFTMTRRKESIFVFTDVRPYNEVIMNTCTAEEIGESTPKPDISGYKSTTEPDISGYDSTTQPDISGYDSTTQPDISGYDSTTQPDVTGYDSTTQPGISGYDSTTEPDSSGYDSTTQPDISGYESTTEPYIKGDDSTINNPVATSAAPITTTSSVTPTTTTPPFFRKKRFL